MKTRNKIVLLLLGLTLFFALIGYNMAMQIEQYNYYTMGMAGYSVLEWNFDISLLLTTVFGFLTLVGTIVCLIFREVDDHKFYDTDSGIGICTKMKGYVVRMSSTTRCEYWTFAPEDLEVI